MFREVRGMENVVREASIDEQLIQIREKLRRGGPEREHERLKTLGKQFVRDRLAKLLDPGWEFENGLFARYLEEDYPADAVVTLVGKIHGRPVAVMAHDFTVKAGTWGRLSIEKIQRIQEVALNNRIPMIYLIDSAAGRLNEQLHLLVGPRASGRIFWNQCRMSGVVPQISVNLGPSPAGSAYMPAFCDLSIMVKGHTSVYLGSPRLAEKATGEKVDHEQMGGADMHCRVSGLGDILAPDEDTAFQTVRDYLTYMPQHWQEDPPMAEPRPPAPGREIEEIVPNDERKPWDMYELIFRLIDEGSWFEIKKLYAPEIITGLARLNGRVIGIVANQPRVKGGVVFSESAEKGAQFISLCTAYNIPLLFLMDVPGFMVSSQTEQTGIIRRGAKMLMAVAQATQARISVVVRKGYGATYMAMSGYSYQPDSVIALPQARLALMAPQPAVNAMYAKKLESMPEDERAAFLEEALKQYEKDIAVWTSASELFLDDVVPGRFLREELIRRFEVFCRKPRQPLIERRTHIFRG